MTRELISKRTRNAFREFLVNTENLLGITMLFEEAGIDRDRAFKPDVDGERRALVEQHYRTLDPSHDADANRLLHIYQRVIERAEDETPLRVGRTDGETAIADLKACLTADGFSCVAGRIIASNPEMPRSLSEVTRRAIRDDLVAQGVSWWGKLSEAEFLGRLYDLGRLPSHDYRFSSMVQDLRKHRENNHDWSDDWVFTDDRINLLGAPDETFLRFLCEMVHPVVRPDAQEARGLVANLNAHLRVDGWELMESGLISGRPAFAASRRSSGAVALPEPAHATDVLSDEYVRELAGKCDERLARSDLEGAITVARTLLEQVLRELEVRLAGKAGDYSGDLPKQFKIVAKQLRIDDQRTDIDDGFKQVARGLVQIVSGIAPIRNRMSDGHARERKPAPHHARVVVNAAKTVATFLVESYGMQRARGVFAAPASSLNTVERTGGDPA